MQQQDTSRAQSLSHLARAGVIAAALATTIVGPARAADDFYKGKTISIILSGSGTYASWARLLAKFMPRYIPGEPTIVVKTMSGAAGLKAANYMYNNAPKDGTEIAGIHSQLPTMQLFNREGIQYDPTKFEWLGNVTRGNYVAYVWSTSVQSIDEAKSKVAVLGGQSVGSWGINVAILTNAMLGTKFKIITGYAGAAEAKIAVERREIDGEFATELANLKASKPDWMAEKKVRIIAQLGLAGRKELADVPILLDYVTKPEDRAAMALYLGSQETDKPYLAPPGVPVERVAILRKAFDSAVNDPAFAAEAAKVELQVDRPMTGQELDAFIKKALQTPPASVQRVIDILGAYSGN